MKVNSLHPQLAAVAEDLLADTATVSEERKAELNDFAQWVANRLHATGEAEMIFICTHNSRRSHLAQVWAQVAADIAGLEGVRTYSGGTEATACNPRTVAAMRRAGFDVAEWDTTHGSSNPTYEVRPGPQFQGMSCFSKVYGHDINPASGFAAVMTCSSADRGCPIVYGSDARFAIPYVDPKGSDGTPAEDATYDERLRQIGREMLFVMGKASETLSTLTAQ